MARIRTFEIAISLLNKEGDRVYKDMKIKAFSQSQAETVVIENSIKAGLKGFKIHQINKIKNS